MQKKLAIIFLSGLLLIACNATKKGQKTASSKTQDTLYDKKGEMVLIHTPFGDMKVKLYDETPLHRDNFKKLVREGTYDSLLFHRVIGEFMIQGGDPESKNAKTGEMLGNGGLGYTIPAEFNKKYIHKKGALAAARQGDDVNPNKASSSCQFYIVHGRKYAASDIKNLEDRANMPLKQKMFTQIINDSANLVLKERFVRCQQGGLQDSLNAIIKNVIEPMIDKAIPDSLLIKYSEEQIKAYSSVGGTPHLDFNYTVFGEVVEGLSIIDSIAAAKKDKYDRPVKDIRMTMKMIK